MTTLVLPDFMPDVLYWAKNNAALAPLHGGRVYFKPNQNTDFPYIRIYEVGGGAINPQIPEVTARISFEIRGGLKGKPGQGGIAYAAARNLAVTLGSEMWDFDPGRLVPIGTSPPGMTYCMAMTLLSKIDLPDAATGDPRFIVDGSFYMRIAGTADP